MFILSNPKRGESERFETRDDLLSQLEHLNVQHQEEKRKASLELKHINDDGEILGKTKISLPFRQTADAYLIDFGIEKPKKKGFSSPGILRQKREEKSVKTDSDAIENISDQKNNDGSNTEVTKATQSRRSKSSLIGLILFNILLSIALAYTFVTQQSQVRVIENNKKTIVAAKKQLNEIKNYQETSPSVDTFSRYFLPNYYTGNMELLQPFLTPELFKEDMSIQPGKLQSVLLENINYDKDKIHLSYVVSIKQDEDKRTVKVHFTVKAIKNADYDYQVITAPEEMPYP